MLNYRHAREGGHPENTMMNNVYRLFFSQKNLFLLRNSMNFRFLMFIGLVSFFILGAAQEYVGSDNANKQNSTPVIAKQIAGQKKTPSAHSNASSLPKPESRQQDSVSSNASDNLGKSYRYSKEARQVWFNHCLRIKNNPQAGPYADSYCECGWNQITHNIPPELFTSNNAADTSKRNVLLKLITQTCMAMALSKPSNP